MSKQDYLNAYYQVLKMTNSNASTPMFDIQRKCLTLIKILRVAIITHWFFLLLLTMFLIYLISQKAHFIFYGLFFFAILVITVCQIFFLKKKKVLYSYLQILLQGYK